MALKLPYTNPDYVLELTGETVSLLHCDFATSIIDQHMGSGKSVFNTGSQTQRYSGDGSQWLDLGTYPVDNVSALNLIDINGVTTAVDSSQYMTPSQHGQADGYLYNPTGWPVGVGNIQVTLMHGAADSNLELVRHVASWIAAYTKQESGVSNIRSETIGTYSVQYSQDNKLRSMIDTQLELLPRHWSITSVGQQPQEGYEGVGRTIDDDSNNWGGY